MAQAAARGELNKADVFLRSGQQSHEGVAVVVERFPLFTAFLSYLPKEAPLVSSNGGGASFVKLLAHLAPNAVCGEFDKASGAFRGGLSTESC